MDIYTDGLDINFGRNHPHLIASCGMTSVVVFKSTLDQTVKTCPSPLMKIWIPFEFSHTIVVKNSSSLLDASAETAALLNIRTHTLSGENHNTTIIEWIN